MDDLKQLQHNGLHYGSTDSNSGSDSEDSTISAVKNGPENHRRNRRPTRRPNPNIHNRNALLARENRRKKKEHLQAMEKELEEMRLTNKQLKKALKQQMKAVDQLQREKKQTANENSPMLNSPGHSNCSRQLCPSPTIFQQLASVENGLEKGFDQNLTSTSHLSDNDFAPSSVFNDAWSDLLDDDFATKDNTQITTVTEDHSYADLSEMSRTGNTEADAGVCLHISDTKYIQIYVLRLFLCFNEIKTIFHHKFGVTERKAL
ncbi:PREDICTED: uncharacterized protein LOC108367391 isoform X3 [Rhagoletis zephyria]|uniref:uncharacterized protein LOC108367391 isoform X3 n=1 Tax=Rhagoletis zephyria TaxID=28612 RepID=UPI000811A931|nr:PREDICTED: uncharacterized protein LOC108367391 isoform X3 [Rhagoletis zephyria]